MILDFDDYRSRRYFPALDGLRALSILLVLTVHLYHRNFSWQWLSGETGVRIFFVLSGYLITMLALREEERAGRLSLEAFYVRRAFRILPLYYLVLGIYGVLILSLGAGGADDRARLLAALPYYLGYLNEYAPPAPFYQSWSLGIEEKFYFVWPILGFRLLANRPAPRAAAAVLLLAAAAGLSLVEPRTQLHHYYPILLGCLVALAMHHRPTFDRLRRLGGPVATGLAWTLLAACQLALERFPVLWHAYPLAVALVLVCTVVGEPRWLHWRPLTFVGERSYGIYLVHILCLRASRVLFPADTTSVWVSLGGLLAGGVLSCLVAELLRRLVEAPCIGLGRQLVDRMRGWGGAPRAG